MGALAPDAKLEDDLNLNSMDRVELMSALEDRYQVEVNDADFTHASTVADLERLLHGPRSQRAAGIAIRAGRSVGPSRGFARPSITCSPGRPR